jgi:DNA-binding XRE family transcriptional regulator
MDATSTNQRITGLDLKLARIARGISQRELARRLEVSPQRVAAIEATRWPTEQMCARYTGALVPRGPAAMGERTDAAGGDRT